MDYYEKLRKSLEEIKVNVDVVGGYWGTALQAAAARGHEKIVQLCLDHGANVNIIVGECGTALQAAAEKGHTKIVQLLLEYGANTNTDSGYYGTGTALHTAAAGGNEKIVQLLLEHGADVNARDGRWGLPYTPPDARTTIKHSSICFLSTGRKITHPLKNLPNGRQILQEQSLQRQRQIRIVICSSSTALRETKMKTRSRKNIQKEMEDGCEHHANTQNTDGASSFKADEELKAGILVRMSGTVSEALLHGEDNLRW